MFVDEDGWDFRINKESSLVFMSFREATTHKHISKGVLLFG
jgi:hypothetical protein